MESRVSAERVNGLSIVEKKTRGTMQLAVEVEVEVEAGGAMLVGSAGAELTSLARAMREAKRVLVCILMNAGARCEFNFYSFKDSRLFDGKEVARLILKKRDRRTSERLSPKMNPSGKASILYPNLLCPPCFLAQRVSPNKDLKPDPRIPSPSRNDS